LRRWPGSSLLGFGRPSTAPTACGRCQQTRAKGTFNKAGNVDIHVERRPRDGVTRRRDSDRALQGRLGRPLKARNEPARDEDGPASAEHQSHRVAIGIVVGIDDGRSTLRADGWEFWGRPNRGYTSRRRLQVLSANRNVVRSDPGVLGGTPVFTGTRVPVKSLFDYLEAGDTLDEFLRQFPSVKREQAVAALELARDTVLARARPA
jgi:uncharacterized protein (DUF433 family)